MQKKIIALAIAGLASSAAFAQSNVTIYGSIDYGYTFRNDARKPDGTSQRGINDSSSELNGGVAQGNRLGFKGTEDLGNGLKAVFLLEQGFGLDASSDAATAAGTNKQISFTRQAYVGLTGGFGTLIGGRLYTPHFSFVSAIDPFGAGTVGQYANVYGKDVNALLDPLRVDNAVAYVSPSFGGFTLTGAFSANAAGQENAQDNAKNNSVYALLARYTAGPVDAGVNYHYIAGASSSSTATSNLDYTNATFSGFTDKGVVVTTGTPLVTRGNVNSIQNLTAGGTFDAKVVKIHALYSWNKLDVQSTKPDTDPTLNNYMLGLTAPIGKATLKASYMLSDGNYAAGGNAQQYAIGANYALSKRTDIYTAYSLIDNDSEVKGGVRKARAAGTGDASNSGGSYQQAFTVGVRHLF